MPRERSKERTRRSGSPRNQPDRNRHERDRQDQRGNQQYLQPPQQRPAGNVPSRYGDLDLQLRPIQPQFVEQGDAQERYAREREDYERRAEDFERQLREGYASQQRPAYAPNPAPSPYSQQQPRPFYPQQAQYTAPPSSFDMSSLTTSLAPGQERGLTAFAGPPGLSRASGPSAGDQSHSSAQPKNRMDISAIIDNTQPSRERIDVNSLLGPESPPKGKDRRSPSNEPPKKRAAVASRSKDKAQPKEKVTSSRSRPPPSGSKQSASLPRDEPVPRVADPRYTANKELELRAIKFSTPRIRDGDIAKKLGEGFDAASVRQQLNRIGRDVYAPPARDWNDNDDGRAMAMMDAGKSRLTIARALNRTDEDVGAQWGRLDELRRAQGRGYFVGYKPREGGT